MISPAKENQIRQLIAKGMSRRQVAADLKVSRDTVARVLKREPRPVETNDPPINIFSGPVGRCPTCGVKVYLPCFACYIETHRNVSELQGDEHNKSEPATNPS